MYRLLFLALAFVVFSCTGAEKVISEEQYKGYVNQSYRLVPDSLMTEEQKRIKEAELLIVRSYVGEDAGKMVLTVGRDYYREQGIPEYYYDMALYELDQNNKLIEQLNKELDDSNKIDVAKLVEMYRCEGCSENSYCGK